MQKTALQLPPPLPRFMNSAETWSSWNRSECISTVFVCNPGNGQGFGCAGEARQHAHFVIIRGRLFTYHWIAITVALNPPVNKYVPFKSSSLQVSLTLFYDPRLWRRGVLTGSASSQQMCSLQNHLTMSSSVTRPSPFLHFCVRDCRGTRLSKRWDFSRPE